MNAAQCEVPGSYELRRRTDPGRVSALGMRVAAETPGDGEHVPRSTVRCDWYPDLACTYVDCPSRNRGQVTAPCLSGR